VIAKEFRRDIDVDGRHASFGAQRGGTDVEMPPSVIEDPCRALHCGLPKTKPVPIKLH